MKLRNILAALLVLCLALIVVIPAAAAEEVTTTGTLNRGNRVEVCGIKAGSGYDWGRIGPDDVAPDEAKASTVVASGSWSGGNVLWEVTSDGTLTLEGSRFMQGATNGTYPWKKYASQVTRIVIKDGLTSIASEAFRDMTNVTSVKLGSTITAIEEYAFWGCSALESVTIPASVATLDEGAFFQCTSLTSVKFEDGIALQTIGDSAFQNTGLTALELPASITEIGSYAFSECAGLTDLVLPEGLLQVGEMAFYDCKNLTNLTIPSTLETIYTDAFRGCGIVRLDLYTNVDFDQHFPYNTTLTTVVFHDNMTTASGFDGCATLTDVTLPDSITTIEDDAFQGCAALTGLTWPANLETIGSYAFARSGITNVELPDTVTTMENNVFYLCKDLVSFKAGSGLTSIANGTLAECTSLTGVDMGSVTSIGFEAFSGCTKLTDVVWSEKLETIGYMAFSQCSALTSVTIPASVKNIEFSVFSSCSNLKEICFQGDAPSIGSYAFRGVTATAYYPAGNSTWTADVMQDYGGTLTWKALQTEPNTKPGDIDGDGRINSRDVILLRQHIAGWDVEIDMDAANVNGDDRVNGLDMILLRQYVAGWDVTLGGG